MKPAWWGSETAKGTCDSCSRTCVQIRAAVCGGAQVHITPAAGKKVEHQGIKVELLGTIELFFDRGNTYDFVAMGALLRRTWCAVAGHASRQPTTWQCAQPLSPP